MFFASSRLRAIVVPLNETMIGSPKGAVPFTLTMAF